jgi:hypothetical protein
MAWNNFRGTAISAILEGYLMAKPPAFRSLLYFAKPPAERTQSEYELFQRHAV